MNEVVDGIMWIYFWDFIAYLLGVTSKQIIIFKYLFIHTSSEHKRRLNFSKFPKRYYVFTISRFNIYLHMCRKIELSRQISGL